jgi:hypothetical protein
MNRVRTVIWNFTATVVATLREIFDETAYERFLTRAGMAPSRASYAAFRLEFEEAKVRRPKCC